MAGVELQEGEEEGGAASKAGVGLSLENRRLVLPLLRMNRPAARVRKIPINRRRDRKSAESGLRESRGRVL